MALSVLESLVATSDSKKALSDLVAKTLAEHPDHAHWDMIPLWFEDAVRKNNEELRKEMHNVAGALTSVALIVRLVEDKLSETDPMDQARLAQIKKHAEVILQLKRGFIDPLFRQLIQQVEQG